MPEVGIRQLKNEASEIIREVREARVEYIVTYRGEPVARILPLQDEDESQGQEPILAEARQREAFWQKWDALTAEIGAAWTSEKSAVELLEEQRRDL
ncbi:MAG: type II toxin-antitoxin system prevent-host-death family antitoxin [Caldilineales bacterium]|nr:type II toxin-antitoxin system prevent-host-death family antitoxin [Caldilineales bacterium]